MRRSLHEENPVPRQRLIIFFFLLYVFCSSSFSYANKSEGGRLCAEANTTVEMQVCLEEEFKKAEALIAVRLKRLEDYLTSEQKEKLYQAQSTWIRFRQENTDFEASGEEGGTLYAVERLAILVEMTQNRAVELEKFFLKFSNSDFK